jgi:hypothetical protein
MTRLRKSVAVAAMTLVMGSLAAGCGGSGPVSGAVGSAISSLTPSRTASISLPTNGPPTPTAEAPPTSEAPETAAAPPPAAASTAAASGQLVAAVAVDRAGRDRAHRPGRVVACLRPPLGHRGGPAPR